MDTSLILWKLSVGELTPSRAETGSRQVPAGRPLATEVWGAISPGLARTALALGVARHRVDDLLQEVWLAASQSGPQPLNDEDWRRWLYRVMVNRCRLEHRQQNRWKRTWTRLVGTWTGKSLVPPSENAAETRELNVKVEAALAQLKPILREIVVLRYFSDFDSREIGEMLGMSDSTVRGHLRSARQTLALALADWNPNQ